MSFLEFQNLKLELAVKAKKGSDFILSAALIWLAIAVIWMDGVTTYQKSVYVFLIASLMLPLAYGLSLLLKTEWKIKNNPLRSLGLWLNFAQLFYFPFLVFILLHHSEYFVMTYAIITGAHLFPYAWFYDDLIYAIAAGIISGLSLVMGLNLEENQMHFIPLITGFVLLVMFVILYRSIPKTVKKWEEISLHNTSKKKELQNS